MFELDCSGDGFTGVYIYHTHQIIHLKGCVTCKLHPNDLDLKITYYFIGLRSVLDIKISATFPNDSNAQPKLRITTLGTKNE